MNELEWRRQLRELRQPFAPRHDLWARIDSALDGIDAPRAQPAATTRRPLARWLVAAGMAATLVLVGDIAWRLHQSTPTVATIATAAPWKPADPRLSGAAVELDAAQIELRQAMQQAPGSVALQRLLSRTEQQQSRLRQLERQAVEHQAG